MKRSKKSIILLCVLALCVGGYLLINHTTSQQTEAATENKETVALTTHSVEELAALSWTADEGTLRFTKTEAGWRYDRDSAFPANATTLDDLADRLTALTASGTVENASDLSIYGLSEPAFTVTGEWSDGTSTTYALGDATAFADGYYVSVSGEEKIYILSTSLKTSFNKTLNALAVKETIPTVENVTRVTTGQVEAQYEEASRAINTDQHWYTPDGTPLKGASVESLISDIQSLDWEELVTGSATEEELSAYGLADEAITLALYDGDTAGRTLLIGNTNEDGDYYAKLPDSKMVYTIASSDLSSLMATTEVSITATHTLLTLPYEDVQAATFTAGNIAYTLETIDLRPTVEEMESGDAEGAESVDAADTAEGADTAEAGDEATAADPVIDPTEDDEALWQQLIALTASGAAEAKEGDTLLTVSVTNRYGTTASLTLREYDADSYQATLNDDAALLVPADKVDKLIRMLKQME